MPCRLDPRIARGPRRLNRRTRTVPETLFAATVARVNSVLALNPKTPLAIAEISRLAGLPSSPVRSALETLSRRGIAHGVSLNGVVVYEPAREAIAYWIAYQAALIDLPWSEALSSVGLDYPTVSAIFVHGSAARGEMRRESDIDVLVIGKTQAAVVYAAMDQIMRITGREIDVACYDPDEILTGAKRAEPVRAILPRAIRVFGEWQ
jgi:predicted nucleotidyltransferase